MKSELFDKQMRDIAQIDLPYAEVNIDDDAIIAEASQEKCILKCFIRISEISSIAAGIVLIFIIFFMKDLSSKPTDEYESFNNIFATLNYNIKETDLP